MMFLAGNTLFQSVLVTSGFDGNTVTPRIACQFSINSDFCKIRGRSHRHWDRDYKRIHRVQCETFAE